MQKFRRSLLVLVLALMAVFMFQACENPFDPLDKSNKIRGLSYIDFSSTYDRWDSDPEPDGVIITLEYFNEFGDALSFHDKPHDVVIEFYQHAIVDLVPIIDPETGEETGEFDFRLTNGEIVFTYPVLHEHSDDEIRIPKEAYRDSLAAAGANLREDLGVFMIVRVFPPEDDPEPELLAFSVGVLVWEDEEAVITEPGDPVEELP